MKPLILVVDGDVSCRDVLRTNLQASGFDVAVLYNASKLLRRLEAERPALLIMAAAVSAGEGLSSLQALRALRKNGDDLPVIMLGERDDEIERIIALETGADDILSKPVNPREVLARVQNVLKRGQGQRLQEPVFRAPFEFSGFMLDFTQRSLTYRGEAIPLTQNEYAILALLVTAPGRVFSRAAIVQRMWEDQSDSRGAVGVLVYRLRNQIKQVTGKCDIIETVRGRGYALKFNPAQ